MSVADWKERLNGVPEKEYGDKYKEHLLEQYKKCIEEAAKISDRRVAAGTFFLTINSALISFMGYAWQEHGAHLLNKTQSFSWHIGLAIVGIAMSGLWVSIITSYKNLNAAKYLVIHQLENQLPAKPYTAEWVAVGGGADEKKYSPVSHIERQVPWVFIGVHIFFLAISIFAG